MIHELICRESQPEGKEREAIGFFADGLRAFSEKSWDEAIGKFRRSLDALGEDEPSHFYIGLCETYKADPPEGAWDGVIHMDRK